MFFVIFGFGDLFLFWLALLLLPELMQKVVEEFTRAIPFRANILEELYKFCFIQNQFEFIGSLLVKNLIAGTVHEFKWKIFFDFVFGGQKLLVFSEIVNQFQPIWYILVHFFYYQFCVFLLYEQLCVPEVYLLEDLGFEEEASALSRRGHFPAEVHTY